MDEILKRLDRIIELLEAQNAIGEAIQGVELEAIGPDAELLNTLMQKAMERMGEDEQIRQQNADAYQCEQLAGAHLYDSSNCCPACHKGIYPPRTVVTAIGPLQLCCKANAALKIDSSVVTH